MASAGCRCLRVLEGQYNLSVGTEFQNIFNRLFLSMPAAGTAIGSATAAANPATPTTTAGAVYTGGYGYIATVGGAGAQPQTDRGAASGMTPADAARTCGNGAYPRGCLHPAHKSSKQFPMLQSLLTYLGATALTAGVGVLAAVVRWDVPGCLVSDVIWRRITALLQSSERA
jgi:hypothetical protein